MTDEEKKQASDARAIEENRPATMADIRAIFGGVETMFKQIGNTTAAGFEAMGRRMTSIEDRQTDFETWRTRTSDRVRGALATTSHISSSDLNQDAAIAELIKTTKELKDQAVLTTTVMKGVEKALGNPIAKHLFMVLALAIIGWLAARGAPAAVPQIVQTLSPIVISSEGGAP